MTIPDDDWKDFEIVLYKHVYDGITWLCQACIQRAMAPADKPLLTSVPW